MAARSVIEETKGAKDNQTTDIQCDCFYNKELQKRKIRGGGLQIDYRILLSDQTSVVTYLS